MAQTMTGTAAGRVNRRFLFLALILASLSAVLVYAAISRSDSGGGGTSAADVPVVVAKAAIPPGTHITAEMLEVRHVPAAAVGDLALDDIDVAVGEVARYPIAANEQVLLSKLVGGPDTASNDVLSNVLEGGMRGMAIQAEAVIGGGGLVLPGDYVDVFWVPGDNVEVLEDHEGAMLVAENVEVVSVEQTIVDLPPAAPGVVDDDETASPPASDAQRVRGVDEEPIPEAVTVTLMLTPEQAARVFCAETGGEIRLAVRAFGDATPSGLAPAICIIPSDEEEDQVQP
jgi:pilus assembly protein CpaB